MNSANTDNTRIINQQTHENTIQRERITILQSEVERLNRQLHLKDDGAIGLKAANENLKTKCQILEEELEGTQKMLAETVQDLNLKNQQIDEMCANGSSLPSTYMLEIS